MLYNYIFYIHYVMYTVYSLTHVCCAMGRCESARKDVEHVFGMLKKRFRFLKLPIIMNNIKDIEHMIHACFILHNMNIEDQGRFDLGHLHNDWIDKGSDVSGTRRALYDATNGRTFFFNYKAHVIEDQSDFTLLGSQVAHPDFYDASKQCVPTESDHGFIPMRQLLVVHFHITNSTGFTGSARDKPMWLKPAAVTRSYK
jgi:hypothetical protein